MRKLLVSLIVLAFAAGSASAITVADGGFENPHFDGQSYAVYANEAMGAWTVTSSEPTGVDLGYDTDSASPIMWDMLIPEGTQFLHIGESARENTISQVVSGFTVGQTYEVSLGACVWGSDYVNGNLLKLYNADTATYDLEATVVGSIRDGAVQNDLLYSSFSFTASNTELVLSITNPAGDAMTIDDITIIPEPATICLLGLGGMLLRRKR